MPRDAKAPVGEPAQSRVLEEVGTDNVHNSITSNQNTAVTPTDPIPALTLAAHGYHVHPLKRGGKAPATASGHLDASTDPATITRQFHPTSNIGIALKPSSLLVIGPDCEERLAEFEQRGLPETMCAQSGSGPDHRHYYYRLPPGGPIHRDCVANEYDIISNGYSVAPPSVTTGPYTWLTPLRPVSELPEAPQWAVDWLRAAEDKEASKPAPAPRPVVSLTASDQEIIDRARSARNGAKFSRLFSGDLSAHDGRDTSHSGADLALLSMLTFWTQDEAQLDRLFERSGLYRPDHWKGSYRDSTLKKSVSRSEYYEPPTSTFTITPGESRAIDAGPFGLTDTGNAERLVTRHRSKVRHNWGRGVWHVWSGKHWEEDRTGHMDQLAKNTATAIADEAKGLDTDQASKTLKWAASSLSEQKRGAMVRLARSEPGIPVEPHELDTNAWLLNLFNGTLDLRTGKLRNHDPNDLITRLILVAYDAQARCPVFDAFLLRIMGGDQGLVGYVWRLIGYSLTGDTNEQAIIIAFGKGSNGKSTLLGVIRDLLGDYAREANADSFMEQRGGTIREDIADLDGSRFVAASETGDGKRLSESLIKKMTGGERLRARRLYENGYEFMPQFKVWLATNHRPEIRGSEHAIWRRIRLVPFEVTISEDEKDKTLPLKLRGELPGILARAVQACMEWQREGLNEPDAVKTATAIYRRDMDIIGSWIEDRCVMGKGLEATAKDLYDDYRSYCEVNGDEPIKQRTFSGKLTERGCGDRKSGSTRYRTGIGLNPDNKPPGAGQFTGITPAKSIGTRGTLGTQGYSNSHRGSRIADFTELNVPNVPNVPNQKQPEIIRYTDPKTPACSGLEIPAFPHLQANVADVADKRPKYGHTGDADTPDESESFFNSTVREIRAWLHDGTLANNYRPAVRNDGRTMPAEQLQTFVLIWLADTEQGGVPEREAWLWLTAVHRAVTAHLAESEPVAS